ncbi:hypothetical protein [Massilia consociata]|uniref:Uncharacterized protein n=1 Tax=Massilia consociata TaxID=760117 RepID=A0ABV6FF93_9BURK
MSNKKWHTHPVIATGIAINVFVLVLALIWVDDSAKLWRLLIEDGIVEWMQFLCFAVTSGLLAFVFMDRLKSRAPRTGAARLELLVLGGLSALVALAALEEISWFQRVLDVKSPDFFAANNRQAETNIHNLALGDGNLHKDVLLKIIFITGMAHNLILPIVARFKPGVQRWIESVGVYLPPLSASIPYLVLVALSHLLVDHPRKGELGELFGAVHYMATVFAAYFVGVGYGRAPLFQNAPDARRLSQLFALLMAFLLLVGFLLSAGAGAGAAAAAGFGVPD